MTKEEVETEKHKQRLNENRRKNRKKVRQTRRPVKVDTVLSYTKKVRGIGMTKDQNFGFKKKKNRGGSVFLNC